MGRPSIFDMVEKRQDQPPKIELLDLPGLAPHKTKALRLNVAGDYFLDGEIDYAYIEESNQVARARDWTVISYSHGWRLLDPTMFDYTVRASCQTEQELLDAQAAGWQTVVVDPGPSHPDTLIGSTVGGRRVIECPKTAGRLASCQDCKALCGRDTNTIIAFPTHGTRAAKGREIVRAMRREQA